MSILPIYKIIALPGSKLWLQNSIYTSFSQKAAVAGDRVTLLAQKEEKDAGEQREENFQPIGLVGVISEVTDTCLLCIHIQNRVNVEDIFRLPDGSFSLTLNRRPDIDDLDQEDAGRRLAEVK